MDIKNIIFDFGGVLMDWNMRYYFQEYFKDDEKMEYFLKNIVTEEWKSQFLSMTMKKILKLQKV